MSQSVPRTTIRMLSGGIFALAAMTVAGVTPAYSADLGGDCCADLEERVLELEATTVRKGNRNISVELYGQVNTAVLWYDNGIESDAYVVDNDNSSTRFGIRGQGSFKPGWSVGYTIEIELESASTADVTERDGDDGRLNDIAIRKSEWFVESDQLGRVTVGQGAMAADGIMEVDLSGPASFVAYSSGADWNNSFRLFDSALGYTGVTWGQVLSNFDTTRRNRVRYDSPAFGAFTLSASWGEDDEWDVALRYAQEWNGVRFAAGIAYQVDEDDNAGNRDFTTLGGSATIWHVPSGLFVVGQYAERDFDLRRFDATSWYVKAGIHRRLSTLGATALYGEYGQTDDLFAVNTDASFWGLGIGQDIDAVGATAYLGYRNYSADLEAAGFNRIEDFQAVLGGMRVPF